MNLRLRPIENHRRKRRLLRSLRRPSKGGAVDAVQEDEDHAVFESKRKLNQQKEGADLLPKPPAPPMIQRRSSMDLIVDMLPDLTEEDEDDITPMDQIEQTSTFFSQLVQVLGVTNSEKRTRRNLKVHFADEVGKELENVHFVRTMYSQDDPDCRRAIILLLSPADKKFEFVHVSYNLYEKTTVSAVVQQLSALATDGALKAQKFSGMISVESGREMLNSAPVQAYNLSTDSLLVGVLKGTYASTMMKMAKPLLENKKIIKAVRSAKRKGRSVKHLPGTPDAEADKAEVLDGTSTLLRKKAQVAPNPPSTSALRGSQSRTGSAQDIDMEEEKSPEEELKSISGALSAWNPPPPKQYLQESQGKVDVTRVLNFGIFAAVLFGTPKKSSRA
eukprot:CAMPEP_0202452364 /NCGR_PEP_ID=MMETSP1360-20130828/10592_1 /ASSEMBLY_ACC=CAM_ASM_000848 /TAXON_ID=515479 /ORGANISM="Licmophora paradoxa, Strain CCMP2313" /LENGTH=388 /DNA_ID=CAMNT_0049071163 /DNA_START=157 /DNA_END=1323 /DNA_ORIENTATION=-